jgi:hypothetical protein
MSARRIDTGPFFDPSTKECDQRKLLEVKARFTMTRLIERLPAELDHALAAAFASNGQRRHRGQTMGGKKFGEFQESREAAIRCT